jgi:hypothetical protein
MSEPFLEHVDFSLARNVLKLGVREKRAIETVLMGLYRTQQTGKDQEKPIRIKVSSENPFHWKNFSDTMTKLGIDVFSSFKEDPVDKTITFQPKLCENNDLLLKGVLASKEATDHFIKSFIKYEPSPIGSKPQK